MSPGSGWNDNLFGDEVVDALKIGLGDGLHVGVLSLVVGPGD